MADLVDTIRRRLEEDDQGWNFYDDHPWQAVKDLTALIDRVLESE